MRCRQVLLLSPLVLLACSSSTSSGPSTDAGPSDASSMEAAADSAPVDSGATCTVSTTDFGAKGALTGTATYESGSDASTIDDDALIFQAPLESTVPTDTLFVHLYPGYGPFKKTSANPTGALLPGTYTLTADDTNLATCGICLLLATNVKSSMIDDDYMATGGTVTITAADLMVGGKMTATLSNVTFEHVHIDGKSFETTSAGDGCTTRLTVASFDATVAAGG